MKNKLSAALVYFALWIVIVLAQILLLGTSGNNPAIWEQPELYYSTLALDLYLIILFYTNYFFIAPYMIKRSLYKEYIFTVIAAAIIGLILPIGLYSAWHWTMPGIATGNVPITSLGSIGAVAVMSIGLAIRGVLEWATLSDSDQETRKKIIEQEKTIAELKGNIASLEEKLTQAEKQVVETEGRLEQEIRHQDNNN